MIKNNKLKVSDLIKNPNIQELKTKLKSKKPIIYQINSPNKLIYEKYANSFIGTAIDIYISCQLFEKITREDNNKILIEIKKNPSPKELHETTNNYIYRVNKKYSNLPEDKFFEIFSKIKLNIDDQLTYIKKDLKNGTDHVELKVNIIFDNNDYDKNGNPITAITILGEIDLVVNNIIYEIKYQNKKSEKSKLIWYLQALIYLLLTIYVDKNLDKKNSYKYYNFSQEFIRIWDVKESKIIELKFSKEEIKDLYEIFINCLKNIQLQKVKKY